MAAHCHHHHNLNTHSITTAASAGDCCCYCSCSRTQPHYPPPPDALVESISGHLFHAITPQSHPYQNLPFNPHNHQQYYPPQPQSYHPKQKLRLHRNQQEESTRPVISSLLRRIDALESSLRHHSAQYSYSLRDVAARTIQSHFRAFLVRRSRTLRQLEHLAYIKSTLNSLKSSVSSTSRFDSQAISHEAMDLLVELESIRGDDPMIRDGKRSISRELVRFMEFIEGISVKRHEILNRTVKNARIGGNGTKSRVLHSCQRTRNADCRGSEGDERELMEKLREKIEKISRFSRDEENVEIENPSGSINGVYGVPNNRTGGLPKSYGGVQAKAKKTVSFADNKNVYRVFRPVSSGSCNGNDSIDDERELIYSLNHEVEEKTEEDEEDQIEEEEEEEDDLGSSEISNDEGNAGRNSGTEFNYEIRTQDDGSFTFSAPVPVKMEPRAELMNLKNNVIVAK